MKGGESMECEKVRDRFSSLWEKELTPSEERGMKDHLSSCRECQREFEQFEKTMRWLHSVEEVEVPDEFAFGLYKKMEERKAMTSAERSRKRWLSFPLPLKLPVQAVAMVAVIFLVLYLAKMMPMGVSRPKEAKQTPSPLSLEKRPEGVLAQKEVERERGPSKIAPGAPRPKDVDRAETAATRKEGMGAVALQMKAEAKRAEEPAPKTEVMGYRTLDSREAAKGRARSREPERFEKGLLARKKSVAAAKPSQEIVLRISDRDKAMSQLRELVKQFKGEIVTTEENGFLVSLPAGSFSEFQKELVDVSSGDADKGAARKQTAEGLGALQEGKKEAIEGKGREPARLVADEGGRVVVRILLVQE
jgi:hypothetical protein